METLSVSDTTTRRRGRPPKGVRTVCPRCGQVGYAVVRRVVSRTLPSEPGGREREYIYIRHGRHYCYIGRMHEDKDKK